MTLKGGRQSFLNESVDVSCNRSHSLLLNVHIVLLSSNYW